MSKPEGTYLGAWDCPYCKTKKIWGHIFECSNCGHPRARNIEFYLPEDARLATEQELALMGKDPNWYCEHCDSGNRSTDNDCWKCEAPRGGSPIHKTKIYEENTVPTSGEEAEASTLPRYEESPVIVPSYGMEREEEVVKEKPVLPPSQIRKVSKPKEVNYSSLDGILGIPSFKRYAILGVGGLFLFAIFACIYMTYFQTHEITATVTRMYWSQNVAIEEKRTLHEEGWNIPAGGRETKRETRQHGWKTITDGYRSEPYIGTCTRSVREPKTCNRNNGNGSFTTYDCSTSRTETYSCPQTRSVPITHQEPVFDTYYYYDIDRWVNVGNYPTSGWDRNPYFADAQPKNSNQRRIELQGTYKVYFSCEELGDFQESFSLSRWRTFDIGQKRTVVVNAFDTIMEIK